MGLERSWTARGDYINGSSAIGSRINTGSGTFIRSSSLIGSDG
jgi:hypothetical protein